MKQLIAFAAGIIVGAVIFVLAPELALVLRWRPCVTII